MNRLVLLSLGSALACSAAAAQSNTVAGLDGRLTVVNSFSYQGRRGAAHPNGEIGAAMMNEMCNPGTVQIPWQAAMQPNHPKFGFLMVRVANDRIEQISDRSFCKHAFTSTNSSSTCGGTCQSTGGLGGTVMGINCSDVYGVGNNADRTWLGPAPELNPWTGVWVPTGSYFDIGDPVQAGYPLAADGVRSLSSAGFDNVKNRVTMKEQDLLTAGAQYFYGIHLMHQGESIVNRWDNLASRGCVPTWNGSTWSFPNNAVGQAYGSILNRWPGATVNSGQNGDGTQAGTDDGRFFVACKTTALGGGNYRYEYAIHNADNNRGGATLRMPVAATATVSNFTFGDIDSNALNDWTGARVGNEIIFTAPGGNALRWNTIYNFGFDCNVQPEIGNCTIDQADIGPGALFVTVLTKVPSGVPGAETWPVGSGCVDCPSSFYEGAFDLANTKIKLTYTASGYTAGVSTNTFVTPLAGADKNMGDDSEVSHALPFTLNYPGGSTTTLRVCSNGFISPGIGNGNSWEPSPGAFLGGVLPRWAPCWHDLTPNGAGGPNDVYIENGTGVVRVTWLNVPNFSGGGANRFQVQFESDGDVHILYETMTVNGDPYLVGWTRGAGAADPGSTDISASLAAGFQICTVHQTPVGLSASDRPIIDTTIDLVATNLPPSTVIGVMILGFTSIPGGFDLGPILDAAGCNGYLTPDLLYIFATPTPTSAWQFVIPDDNTLAGMVIMSQALTISPGFTNSGYLTSNGVQLKFGLL